VAYADGRIFSAALDGRLFAFDANKGTLIWSVDTVSPQSANTITGAPRVFDGKVIIGNGGADFGARGYVTAYDQATGKQLWRFYTVPGAPEQNKGDPALELAAKSWAGAYWQTGTGGEVWDSISFDRELNQVYIGTGNAAPYDPEMRSPGNGDNLYTAAIVALNAKTGEYVWHYQVNPRDAWDYDCTQQMTLADLVIDGKKRKVLMQAPKNGFFYVIDRITGKLISAEKFGKASWASRIDLQTGRPDEAPSARYDKTGDSTVWPAGMGAHSWQSMSFDPKTALVYIPYMQEGVRYLKGKPQPGGFDIGYVSMKAVGADSMDGKGALIAWNPVRQKAVWRAPHETIWNGGAMATAGGLVFQGAGNGFIDAYDAASGSSLWRFNAGLGVVASPISFLAQGKQYIAILVGYGGASAIWGSLMDPGWKFGVSPRRLLTFAIGGTAKLPPSPPPDKTVHARDDPKFQIKASDVDIGHDLFRACAPCHGLNLVSGGAPAPDLRESAVALDPQALYSIVHDGTLIQQGMPRFEDLTREQVLQIYDYIRAGARNALGDHHD
jgi:quinohemoprotein ethanol dehydrogenase